MAAGVEAATAARPSVVTMDLELPVMDGIEATRAITALGIPVVVITGSHPERTGEAVAAGAVATIAKPEGHASGCGSVTSGRAAPAKRPTRGGLRRSVGLRRERRIRA
jgi:chemotaxis response regulator CheB